MNTIQCEMLHISRLETTSLDILQVFLLRPVKQPDSMSTHIVYYPHKSKWVATMPALEAHSYSMHQAQLVILLLAGKLQKKSSLSWRPAHLS